MILRYVFWHSIVAGGADRPVRNAAGLRLPVHRDGGEVGYSRPPPGTHPGAVLQMVLACVSDGQRGQWNRTGWSHQEVEAAEELIVLRSHRWGPPLSLEPAESPNT